MAVYDISITRSWTIKSRSVGAHIMLTFSSTMLHGQCILWPINNHFKIKIKNIKKLQSILLSIVQYIKVEIAFTIFKKSNII